MQHKIITLRNIFYKLFFFGFLLYLLNIVLFVLNNAWVVNTITANFHLTWTEANFLIAYFMGWTKMITILFFLFPALALHWQAKKIMQDGESDEITLNIKQI